MRSDLRRIMARCARYIARFTKYLWSR